MTPQQINDVRRTWAMVAPIADEAASLCVHPFSEGDLSLYADFDHPRGWGRREVRAFLDREFRRHPAVSPIVRRQPPHFTSNHAPFLLNFC